MSSKPHRWARGLVLASFLLGVGVAAYAAEAEQAPDAGEAAQPPESGAPLRQPLSSEKRTPEEGPSRGDERRILGPHGSAMDGVRGSGIAPAPGAFGTDAGSPSDLHR